MPIVRMVTEAAMKKKADASNARRLQPEASPAAVIAHKERSDAQKKAASGNGIATLFTNGIASSENTTEAWRTVSG